MSGNNDPGVFGNLFSSQVYKTIMGYNTDFVNGNFDSLQQNLTLPNFNQLSSQLLALKIPDNPYYEQVRNLIGSILQNLYQATNLYTTLLAEQKNCENCYQTASILDSIPLLTEYIDKLRRTNFLFSSTVTAVAAKVKEEYAIYLSLYGVPEGGVFDPDKLAAILQTINASQPVPGP